MDKVICFGTSKFSYNTSRLISSLESYNIKYQYSNIYEAASRSDLMKNIEGSTILLSDNDLLLYKEDFDIAMSAITNNEKSRPGLLYSILKNKNIKFYNDINNHFKSYNKWTLYNLLASLGIATPSTYIFARTIDIKSPRLLEAIDHIKTPFIVRSCSARDKNNYQKLGFICTGYDDLVRFYEESILAGQHSIYVIQQYIPHDYYITANKSYNNIRYFITESISNVSIPVKCSSHDRWVESIGKKLKLNCFSVSFINTTSKNIIIKIKVPGEIALTDLLYNVNVTDEIVKGFMNV